MSDKTFNLLNKYYTFSKKYVPLILFGAFFIMLLCKLPSAIVLGVYFGLLLAHLCTMLVISRIIKKRITDVIQESIASEEILNNEKQQ